MEARQNELKTRLEKLYTSGERPWEAEEASRDLESGRDELKSLYGEWEKLSAALED